MSSNPTNDSPRDPQETNKYPSQKSADGPTVHLSSQMDANLLGNPVVEPLHLSTVWQMDSIQQADALLSHSQPGFVYRRDGHPNADSLSADLARIHGADQAIITAQGMSSLSAICLAHLQPGDRIAVAHALYGRSLRLLTQDLARWGVVCETFDPCDNASLESISKQPWKLVLVETIANPLVEVIDIARLANIAHQSGGLLVVDNTFATPAICQPIALGADLVWESLSKMVCGHSDAMCGLLCGKAAAWGEITNVTSTWGLAASPMDCWLTRRGLMTLDLRMQQACLNAMELAKLLDSIPGVRRVFYPGLENHPQHELARKQFSGRFANMMAIDVSVASDDEQRSEAETMECVQRWIQNLQVDIPFCPSLGEAHTTISHPVSTSHRGLTPYSRKALGITMGVIRISVGIEPTAWILEKFQQAAADS